HAHVVRAGAVHAGDAQLGAPEEVAATDDDGDLHAVAHGDADLPRDTSHDVGVQPHAAAAERLARQLEQDAPGRLALRVHRHGLGRLVTHWSVTLRSSLPGLAPGRNTARPSGSPPPRGAQAADPSSRSRVRRGTTAPRPTEDIETSPAPGWVPATGPPGWTARVQVGPARAEARTGPTGRRQEPTRKRTKEVSEPFTEATCLPTVTFGSLASGWSTSTTSLKKPFRRPSTILGSAASGLPSFFEVSSAISRSFSTTSAGTSSRVRYFGAIAAMCCATSLATAAPASSVTTTTPIDGGRSFAVRCR